MEERKVDMFMMANSKYLKGNQVFKIREELLQIDDSKWGIIQSVQFKDPVVALVVALFGGGLLGIDRFMIGDTVLGIIKLCTFGGFVLWALLDILLIMGAAKSNNTAKLRQVMNQR
jgi:TM2 domain-containing membrane protein YozV